MNARDLLGVAVTFTATRHMQHREDIKLAMRRVIDALPEKSKIIVGGCYGGDAYIARHAYFSPLNFHVHAVLPADRRQLDPEWELHCHSYEEMPLGTTFRKRDERMVELGTHLIGFPEYPEKHGRSLRSGTWMTIRIAQRTGRPWKELQGGTLGNGFNLNLPIFCY